MKRIPIETPAESAGPLYVKTDISPEEIFQAIGRLRKEARDEIYRLIRFLDKTDDYVSRELEDEADAGPCDTDELEASEGDDEPDLGFLEPCTKGDYLGRSPWDSKSFSQCRHQGGNATYENEGDDSDDEPSLGFIERHCSAYGFGRDFTGNQEHLCVGRGDDLEDEHDGAEPPEDDEPSLGWTTSGVLGGISDFERDPAESGIGDADGLLEQIGSQDWQRGGMV
jgi:hypothetical protein